MRLPISKLRSLLAAFMQDRPVASALRRRKAGSQRSAIEGLEPRQLLSATHLAFGTVPATGFLGSPLGQIVVDVEDGSNAIVTTDTSKVTLTVHSGPTGGKIVGHVTVNAVAGVATFSHLELSKLGTYTLTATDVTETSLTAATSGNVAIEAAPVPTTLMVSQPANNTAGSTLSTVTVTVKDQYGNTFTRGHPMVSLGLFNAAAGAKLFGKMSVQAVDGIATFTGLSLNETGTFELRASEGAGSHAVTMTTQSFTVTAPAVAHSLVFGQDVTNVIAGANMAPAVTVKVVDQYGNTVTSDKSTIKLTSVGPQTKTFSAHVVNGIATFSAISLEEAGSYHLDAADSRTTDGHSLTLNDPTAFTVSAAAADHLLFQQIPTNNSTHSGSFTVKAAVVDQFGNTVTSNTSTVTLALASGPSGATLHLTTQATAGIATFSGVTFTAAGHYRLSATDGALKAGTSNTFTLT